MGEGLHVRNFDHCLNNNYNKITNNNCLNNKVLITSLRGSFSRWGGLGRGGYGGGYFHEGIHHEGREFP